MDASKVDEAKAPRTLSFWARTTWRKSLKQLREEESYEAFERTITLFDLIMIGIGGTVGSGVFATAGLVCPPFPDALLYSGATGLGDGRLRATTLGQRPC